MNNFSVCSIPVEQIRAAMFGHAIADAMGVPVEFVDRSALQNNPVTDYRGFGSHPVPAGTWSDDTSMAIATLESLTYGLDYDDMMRRFCNWKQKAMYTATDEVFDMGITTSNALGRFLKGTPALECGCCDEYDNGNGSLMRIMAAALYCKYKIPFASLESHMDLIHNISQLTHSHRRSLIGCGIYALILIELLNWRNKYAIRLGIKKAKAYYRTLPEFKIELSHYKQIFGMYYSLPTENEIKSGGYVVDTLEAAIWCVLTTDSYSECILKAVNLGSDTDTVAAVAGGLAGVLYGIEGIPVRWREELIRNSYIEDLCKAFADNTFTEELRSCGNNTPILMVTAKHLPEERCKGFIVGTDDYMVKPVNEEEMLLRIKALLRRSQIASEHKLRIGKVTLDYDALSVSREGVSQTLPQKEFQLLYKLLSYPDRIFTRLQLMDEIWGMDSTTVDTTVNVHITRLRRRFENWPEFEIIAIRGIGYKGVIHRGE